jgi:transposase
VGNALNEKELLPDRMSLVPCSVNKEDDNWAVSTVASSAEAICPDCGVLSTARHSSYLRHLKDLPVQGRPKLVVHVARWRCRKSAGLSGN